MTAVGLGGLHGLDVVPGAARRAACAGGLGGEILPLPVITSESMAKGSRAASGLLDHRADRRSVLLALLDMVRTEVDLDTLLLRIVDLVAQAMQADRATLFLLDRNTGELVSRAAHLPELPEIRLAMGQGIAGYVAQTRRPVNIPHADDHPRFSSDIDRQTGYKTVTVLAAPMLARPGEQGAQPELLGVLQVLNRRSGVFDDGDRELLCELADEVATALVQTALRERVTGSAPERYHRIIGSSPPMRRVYEIIARAAATAATVLVRGESGTGKELAARAIHYNSDRARGPFVKIDCTAIPEGLMESELFGHERGAFTGAEQRVLGKAELADGGTLFLDEIGDLKLSLQGKLLRLLQDREFERVGGRKTIAVDVRIVAATNRDLLVMADAGTFRKDLYYRLKVIELELPTLSSRGPEDIERLALHFADLYARRHKKNVRGLSPEALGRLRRHSWPGNIRELEHCIESAVALCAGEIIAAHDLPLPGHGSHSSPGFTVLPEPPRPPLGPAPRREGTPASDGPGDGLFVPDGLPLEEVEVRYIQRTIERCGGNRSEAARLLGIGRNTLLRKLREVL